MNRVTLEIKDENIELVLSILENLKAGLISDIQTNANTKVRKTRYQAKVNTIIREEDSGTHDTTGKYASAASYKQKLRAKR